MQVTKHLEHRPVHDARVAHRYENMIMYVSLTAFLAMASIFFLILSL